MHQAGRAWTWQQYHHVSLSRMPCSLINRLSPPIAFTGEGLPRTCLHHRKGKDLDLPVKLALFLLPLSYYQSIRKNRRFRQRKNVRNPFSHKGFLHFKQSRFLEKENLQKGFFRSFRDSLEVLHEKHNLFSCFFKGKILFNICENKCTFVKYFC